MPIPAGTEWTKAATAATTAPRVAPTSGMRSAIATNSEIRLANGTPAIFSADVGQDAADDADEQVAGDVPGDRPGAVATRHGARAAAARSGSRAMLPSTIFGASSTMR